MGLQLRARTDCYNVLQVKDLSGRSVNGPTLATSRRVGLHCEFSVTFCGDVRHV